MHFPVSGINCSLFVPIIAGFAVSAVTAAGGISGAFLLLPFQVNVLGFASPAVSPTNLIYNLIATPGGIFRYRKEGRMLWPLAWTLMGGTLPGVFLGALIRVRYLPDAHSFKLFAGAVLLCLGAKLVWDAATNGQGRLPSAGGDVKVTGISASRVEFEFLKRGYSFGLAGTSALAVVVGLVGGIYGVGGGAIIAPFLVSVLGLPVYAVAGATLLATFATSVAGVAAFELLGVSGVSAGAAVRPDWLLGMLFGIGGLVGTYTGARLQRRIPERAIKAGLALAVLAIGAGMTFAG